MILLMHSNDTIHCTMCIDFYIALKGSTYSMLVAFVQNEEKNRKLGMHKARRRRKKEKNGNRNPITINHWIFIS